MRRVWLALIAFVSTLTLASCESASNSAEKIEQDITNQQKDCDCCPNCKYRAQQ